MKKMLDEWEKAGQGDYWMDHEKRPFWSIFPKTEEEKFPSFCAWHYGFSVITGGGPVAPCCAVSKDRDDFGMVVPGRVRFRDVWNNELYQTSRAAFAGKDVSELKQVSTVCQRCYFPKFVQHLYSVHDFKVSAQFGSVFGGTEPVLEQAFALLNDPTAFPAFFAKHLRQTEI
jgi:hypothetical protein